MGNISTEHLGSLLGVVDTTKDSVHVLKGDTLGLRDKEEDKDGEQNINAEEEEETLEASLGQESGEELLEDGVGHVLALGSHTDGLEHDNNTNSRGLGFGSRGSETNDRDDQHANSHTDGTNHENPATTKAVSSPHSVEGEQDTHSGPQCVDEVDLFGRGPDLLVDGSRVCVEGTLAGELLTDVENNSDTETLSERGVLEECADTHDFFLDLFFGISDAAKGGSGVVDFALLDEETGDENLEDNNHAPVPLSELLTVLSASIVDPVGDEGTDRVEELPEGHDLTSNLSGRDFTDVDSTLSNTNEDTAEDEDSKLTLRGKGLDDSCNNGDDASNSHTSTSTKPISLQYNSEHTVRVVIVFVLDVPEDHR
ncbi:hypothetical protein HG531_002213 [Fusarium graminearum]|nr:hypothetical protein HG531_002213 [Fusarium graminearum]